MPSVGVAGAVSPFARRTMTVARSASAGLVQDKVMLSGVRSVAASAVTWPGGVVSGAGRTCGAVLCGGLPVHT